VAPLEFFAAATGAQVVWSHLGRLSDRDYLLRARSRFGRLRHATLDPLELHEPSHFDGIERLGLVCFRRFRMDL
jgi:hypothetical protein